MAARSLSLIAPTIIHIHTHTHTLARLPLPTTFPRLHPPYHHHHHRHNSTTTTTTPSPPTPPPTPYTFAFVKNLISNPPPPSAPARPRTIIIDVREPAELRETGRIPGAYSMPLTSNPDAFALDDGDFFDRFGFPRPRAAGGDGDGEGEEGVEEVIFYCKAGVRSRAAARMAREWEGVRAGDMRGGWMEWEGRGGEVER